jgi:hypothetical protein
MLADGLSLSPTRTLVTPYCKRTRPGRRTTQRQWVSPLLSSPLCVPSRSDPSGLGHAATIYSSVQGPPRVETPIVCYKCGKPSHFIAKCPLSSDSDRGDDKKGKRKEKKRYYKKKGGDAHVCREWDSDESSSDEDAANIAITKGLLFPNVGHKCLMAKDGKRKKVKSKSSTKYQTSSDEDNSCDEEDNLRTLFANLNMQQKEKLNELISAIHDFLIKENKKHVKVKNAYALEVEKCEKISSELSTYHDTIANLRNENAKCWVHASSPKVL